MSLLNLTLLTSNVSRQKVDGDRTYCLIMGHWMLKSFNLINYIFTLVSQVIEVGDKKESKLLNQELQNWWLKTFMFNDFFVTWFKTEFTILLSKFEGRKKEKRERKKPVALQYLSPTGDTIQINFRIITLNRTWMK